jgi:hypothetical protein
MKFPSFAFLSLVTLLAGGIHAAYAQQWLTNVANIGSASAAPTLSFAGETYTFAAAGTDIAGTSDQFGFVHGSVTGDTEIVAWVDSIQNTSTTAKSGVMIRESLAANAAHVAIVISPTTGARFIYRSATGGSTTTLNTTGIAAPQWVRLVRDDNYFTGYTSPDGVRWRMIGTVTLPLATNMHVGIAVCSRTSGTLCQSLLSRVDFLDLNRPSLTTYNWPAGIPQSDKYQVKVIQNGVTNTSFVHMTRPEDRQNLGTQGSKTVWYTHGGRTFSWSSFAAWGPVTVEVKKLFGTAATPANITLSPKRYGLTSQLVDGHTVRFTLDRPQYVSVKFDVAENRVNNRPAEIKHGLMIFADPPELTAPRTNDPGVVEWNPNVNQSGVSVLYLAPGKAYLGPGATNANGTFQTNGAAGNFHLAANQSMYLAGGAYAWFSDWGPTPNAETFIGGRGIISGVKQVFGFWTPGGCCWQAFETARGYEGVTFVDLPHHALGFNSSAVVRRIKIASWHTNQDGLRGGQNTLAENNFLKCNDDYYYPGLHVRRTVIWPMWNGSTTQLGWGGYNNSNTRMYDCDVINPEWDHANKNQGFFGGANLWWSDKGDNHTFENIRIEGAINRLVNINMVTNSGGSVGYLRNVTFRNVTLEKRQYLSKDNVFSKSRLQGVVLNGVPCLLTNWLFENLKIEGEWITGGNAATHIDIDPLTTTNIRFLVTAPGPPVAPYGLSASATAPGQVSLNWKDDSGTESAFEIRRATASGGPWTTIATVSSNVLSYLNTSLPGSTTYYYGVRATNASGVSAWSGNASATTQAASAPGTPTGLSAMPGFAQVGLTWNISAGATGYRIKRALAVGGPFNPVGGTNATGYVDIGLMNGTQYYYVVSATNAFGESVDSPPVSATPGTLGNLILNGGIEGVLSPWTEYNGANCDVQWTTSASRTGSGSARVYNRTGQWTGVQQQILDILLTNGPGYYAYSAWGRTESGSVNGYVTVRLVDSPPGTRYFAAPGIMLNSSGWQRSAITNFLNWTNLSDAYLYFETSSTNLDSFLVDDFSLQYFGAVLPTNAVPKGSVIADWSLTGSSLVLAITNGVPNGSFHLLTTTNLSGAGSAWTTNLPAPLVFDSQGKATVTNLLDTRERYYRVREMSP